MRTLIAIFLTSFLLLSPTTSTAASCKHLKKPQATTKLIISGNVDATASGVSLGLIPETTGTPPTTTYEDLSFIAAYSTSIDVFDSLGAAHSITFFFFKDDTNANSYQVRGYVNNEEVDSNPTCTGYPRQISNGTNGDISLMFANGDGRRTNTPAKIASDLRAVIRWQNGAKASRINVTFKQFTQYAYPAAILKVRLDGRAASKCS